MDDDSCFPFSIAFNRGSAVGNSFITNSAIARAPVSLKCVLSPGLLAWAAAFSL